MTRPRIFFVNRVYRPSEEATAQLLADLAEGLVARGWEVHVIAAGEQSDVPGSVVVHRTGPGDRHGGLLSRIGNYTGFLRASRRLLSALVQPGDKVVLMTDPPLLAVANTGPARKKGAQVIHWIQDIYPEIVPQYYGAWAGWPLLPLKWARDRVWRQAVLCLPVGEDMHTLVAARGVAAEKIAVMPNWAPRELDRMPTAEEVAAYRLTAGVPAGFVVGYSGNLGRVHEFQTFLDAAAELNRDNPPACSFRFTASGPQLAAVSSARESNGLTNLSLHPPAPRRDLALNLAASAAHLVTLNRGFESLVNPSKVAGILAAARPVLFVGPPDCALAAFIRREQIGAVIAPGDAVALARTIRAWAANDGAEAVRIGRNARACYERHFTVRTALDQWEAWLRPPGAALAP